MDGAESFRILYLTELDSGDLAAASGMAFIPTAPATSEPRPIVAWTHGTVGEGDACAPSRQKDPASQLTQFLPSMIQLGWALVATDYTGLGTPGVQAYLLKDQEIRDTVNSVRALQQIPHADVGSRYTVLGHSQGGHTALWTGHLSKKFAPELEVMRLWSLHYPNLPTNEILTRAGQKNYDHLARECIKDAALEAEMRSNAFNEQFFSSNPSENPAWVTALNEQTPP
ncbi:hypothetical protein N9D51_02085, partial [Actinomycetota bacterium]|nr:hypothetical protein [Actinomycetota bacterium]